MIPTIHWTYYKPKMTKGSIRDDLASVSLCRKVKRFRRQVCVQLDANSPVPCQVAIVRAGGRRADR